MAILLKYTTNSVYYLGSWKQNSSSKKVLKVYQPKLEAKNIPHGHNEFPEIKI